MRQVKVVQVPAISPPLPAAPNAPAIAGVQGATVVTPATLSARDVDALKSRGNELTRQLKSANSRRADVQRSLRSATGADRTGLEQRLGVLDARITRLDGDIGENGSQLASLAANRATSNQPPFPGDINFSRNRGTNMVPIVIVFTLFVLMPIALSISRMLWKRGSLPKYVGPSPESTQRLERMEQAIDSIAIEIERVSEGQRFITRLMSDRQNALGVGQPPAQPIAIPVAEKVGTSR